jgi:hypothetical protein
MEKFNPHLFMAALAILLQQVLILRLLWDSAYGCLKKEALPFLLPFLGGYTFIFLDLDHFGQVNARLGYEQANRLVRRSLRSFWRSGDVVLVFRIFSGDELLVAVRTDLPGARRVAGRLQGALAGSGLSATMGIAARPEAAADLVRQAKPKEGPRPLEGGVIEEVL